MGEEAVADLSRPLGKGMGADEAAALRQHLYRIYAPERLYSLLSAALAVELAGQDAKIIDQALRFYDGPLGRRIVGLELSARRALLDDDQARIADDRLALAQERRDRRVEQIERLMAATDVVETAVLSGLNGCFAIAAEVNRRRSFSAAASAPVVSD